MQLKTIVKKNRYAGYFGAGDMILDIQTSTRFWRTSALLRADVILAEENMIRVISMISEREADEYDILIALAGHIRDAGRIFTFNGKSFDVPHLIRKYKAYRMECAIEEKSHIDLMLKLRKYDPLFGLSSHRLRDYLSLLPEDEQECTDAEATYSVMPLLGVERFVNGSFEVLSCITDREKEEAHFELAGDLPCRIGYASDYFTVSGGHGRAAIKARIEQGSLRMYHTDYHNYLWLPAEGYAVHKSVASYVAASRKTAADRNNCYTYIPFNEKFIGNTEKMSKYLVSVLQYCIS